jgi:hypothetical protein
MRALFGCGLEVQSKVSGEVILISRRIRPSAARRGRLFEGAHNGLVGVRILPAPPRSPTQTEISRCRANSRELAGLEHVADIVWLEVRVLPAPPRSLTQTEISRFSANSPELAGILARVLSAQSVDWISRALSGPLSLPPKIAFPKGRGGVGGDLHPRDSDSAPRLARNHITLAIRVLPLWASPCAKCSRKKVRQLGDVRHFPPCLVAGEQVGC